MTATNCEFGNFESRPVVAMSVLKRIAGIYKLTEKERERETHPPKIYNINYYYRFIDLLKIGHDVPHKFLLCKIMENL